MKFAIRAAFLLLVSALVLYFMQQRGLFEISYFAEAFKTGTSWVLAAFGVQLLLSVSMALRYTYLARLFGFRSRSAHVSAATFVSTAVGQWAPGALAVTEVLRVGLMMGADKHSEIYSVSQVENESMSTLTKGVKARLAVASLFDRLIGFFVILVLGSVVTFSLLYSDSGSNLTVDRVHSLELLGSISFLIALGIASLPVVCRMRLVSRLLFRLMLISKKRAQSLGFAGKVFRGVANASKKLRSLQITVVQGSAQGRKLLVPVCISVVSSLLTACGLYLASLAVGQGIDFLAIVAVFPMIALSSVLPIGFGGMGGQQLVAVALFDIFALSPAAVSSASLLQNMLLLTVNTLLGLIFAQHSAAQIKAILQSRRNRRLESSR